MKTHPMESSAHFDLKKAQQAHTYEVCGLAANLKDRSIVHTALHCLSIAAEVLETSDAQEEVLGIFDKLTKDSHWHVESMKERLKRQWNWPHHPTTVDPAQMHTNFYELDPALSLHVDPTFAGVTTNPLLNAGDFSMENHPYRGYYVPPHHHHHILDQYPFDSYLV